MKNKIPNDPTKTMGLYSLVSVATAAKYDLTTNIQSDVTDGLTKWCRAQVCHRKQTTELKIPPDQVLFGSHFHILTYSRQKPAQRKCTFVQGYYR